MKRNELSVSNEAIIKMVEKSWNFATKSIDYIDVGGTFAFRLVGLSGDKAFLKIYLKSAPSNPVENVTSASLQRTCAILDRLRNKHHLLQTPMIIRTNDGNYFYEENDLLLMLCSYLEGQHPGSRYDITGTTSKQLASIFRQLHFIPTSEYPELKQEEFNIDYALGIEKWLNASPQGNANNNRALEKISESKEGLYKCLTILKQYQAKLINFPKHFVLTHGDGHHFNILQNDMEVFLIDWDDIKIGPRERDLWFYEFTPLMDDYIELNSDFKVNHDLCLYYQTQRFLEDFRIYLEDQTSSEEQKNHNSQSFLNHWGWKECYARIKNL